MPLPLREPFFLKGRSSVVHRAVIMSVVLGTLALGASWLVTLCLIVCDPPTTPLAAHLVAPIAMALFVYAPLDYWNHRPLRSVSLVLLFGGVSMFCAVCIGWLLAVLAGVPEFIALWIGPPVLVAISGRYLFRQSPSHVVAFRVSLMASLIPMAVTAYLYLEKPFAFGAPREVEEMLMIAATFSSWFSIMSIPWGIPFWWPPAKDAAAVPVS